MHDASGPMPLASSFHPPPSTPEDKDPDKPMPSPHETQPARNDVLSLFDLTGDTAVVIGAGSGLGRATAEVLASAGGAVGLVDVNTDRLETVAKQITADGVSCLAVIADMTNPKSISRAVQQVKARFGGLDVVCVNVEISHGLGFLEKGGMLPDTDPGEWGAVTDVNLHGVFNTLSAAAEEISDGGRILVTTSTAGLRADPLGGYAYGGGKAPVLNIARQAALELAPRSNRVNPVAPGPVRTNIAGEAALSDDPALGAQWARTIPLGRMADPEELKGLVLLLASKASSFITGGAYAIGAGAPALSHSR